MLTEIWNFVYFQFFHSMFKCFVRLITGKCELLRITYNVPKSGVQTDQIESSLRHSKTQSLKSLLTDDNIDIDEAVKKILKIKSVSPEVHPQFGPNLKLCLSQIVGYRQLITDVECVRKIQYSSEKIDHEAMLMQLWRLLMPDTTLNARISKQWTDIGFQGDDPMTDFRGMGLLGLKNLLFFATKYPEAVKQLLSHSNHPQYGYSFAIVGINITGLTHQLLISGHLKTHFYNAVQGRPRLDDFQQVYCYLLYEFDKFWFEEKPRDIMQFNPVKEKFTKNIINILKNKNAALQLTVSPQRLETHV